MYCGEAYTSVDDKGRINIPKEFRTQMDEQKHHSWFVTRGFDGALFVFEESKWQALLEQVKAKSMLEPKMLDFRRFLIGGVSPVKLDPQGRFSLPAPLRDYAQIERDAVMMGVGDHLEIWCKRVWLEYQKAQAPNFKTMASELFDESGTAACGAA